MLFELKLKDDRCFVVVLHIQDGKEFKKVKADLAAIRDNYYDKISITEQIIELNYCKYPKLDMLFHSNAEII